MMHKDHKVEPEKGRAVATAISSNTTGLSNAVSDYVESLANSIKNPVEVISTEDMLNRTEEHNEEVREMIREYEESRDEKLKCTRCRIVEARCRTCADVVKPYRCPKQNECDSRSLSDNQEPDDYLEACMPSERKSQDEHLEAQMPGWTWEE